MLPVEQPTYALVHIQVIDGILTLHSGNDSMRIRERMFADYSICDNR